MELGQPSWDNTTEYRGLNSEDFKKDYEEVKRLAELPMPWLAELARALPTASTLPSDKWQHFAKLAQSCSQAHKECCILLWNLQTYVSCELSVDGKNAEGREKRSQLQNLSSEIDQIFQPLDLFLKIIPEGAVSEYLRLPESKPETFLIQNSRLLRHTLLPLEQENLITSLEANGIEAWSTMYDNIAGSLSVEITHHGKSEKVGMATLDGYLQSADGKLRQIAYQKRNQAWNSQEEACAAALNAIAGWRLELYKTRSHTKSMHFLDFALHQSRISKATLEAIMTAVDQSCEVGRRALRAQAKALGKTKLDPWDLMAPCPSGPETQYGYAEALRIISSAYADVDPEMGRFVDHMEKNKWIEGRVTPTKRPGAYCTEFWKSSSPRVYMTYQGTMGNIGTLAHELGHAFHSWVMRDMDFHECFYPMTLAETASIFGETVVKAGLSKSSKSKSDVLKVAWEDSESAAAFLLNIPARFEFEKNFYEIRRDRALSPSEFKELTKKAWEKYYGDTLSEYADMYWATKLHFYIRSTSFYNFPYTFGYLFGLGVYALKEKLGREFYPSYVKLLRDTGRMTPEELARKHLQVDITRPDFWLSSIGIVEEKVRDFENLVKEV